ASGNRRNYFFIALLAAASLAVLLFHLAAMGHVDWPARAGLQVGLDLVLFIVAVIGGRVIPMFTNNGVPGAGATRHAWVERASLGGLLALLALDAAGVGGAPLAVLALATAVAHGARLWLWRPLRTLRTPLVWVLHAAYAWIVVHLVLRALAQWGQVAEPLALHALTIGVIGGMTIGMMTRTSRGHTGRPLAADRFEVACYGLVQLAAVTRVLGGLAAPDWYLHTVVASGVFWSLAFAIYAVRYWPVLTRPRVDGKPG
ncbi:MAG TPA: NnrS family protein, partial [Gemmatimonadales bacterium]|nr:NnrS family protein [Gemmatimonadales bacterium]